MMGKTHMLIGAAVGAVMEVSAPGFGVIEGIAVGAIGGLMPDLDHPKSILTQKVAPIALGGSRKVSLGLTALLVLYLGFKGWLPLHSVGLLAAWLLITAFSKHRGITHSIIGLALAIFAVKGWLGTSLSLAFGASYASHLLADALTHDGVPLFYPLHWIFHVPTGLKTGTKRCSMVEGGFSFVSLAYMVLSLWNSMPRMLVATSHLVHTALPVNLTSQNGFSTFDPHFVALVHLGLQKLI